MTEPRTITISEASARILLRIASQMNIPAALGKIQQGQAMLEVETALQDMDHKTGEAGERVD